MAPLELSRLVLLRVASRPFATLEPFAAPEWTVAERALASLQAEEDASRALLEASLYEAAGPGGAADAPSATARHAVLSILRSIHNGRLPRERDLAAAGPRVPRALREEIERHESLRARRLELTLTADALAHAASGTTRSLLASALADPLVQEGIASAASELAAKLRRVLADEGASRHGDRHVSAKALAYLARFATKTSPNGVFCATSLGRIDGSACRVEGVPGIARTEVLLSVAEARKVACTLAADPAVEAAVVPRANTTLRDDPEGYTFWRVASARRPDDRESLSRVREHPIVRAVLDEIAAGAPSLPELRRRVAARVGVEDDVLAPFLRRLIDSGIVIAEIEIPYDERRPLRFVAGRARAAGCDAPWIDTALGIEDAVDDLSALPWRERASARARIAGELEALPRARELSRDELFRTDAAAAAEVTLPSQVLDELTKAVSGYARLFAAMYPAARYRAGWVRRFLAKFPADADVDLLDVYRTLTEEGETYRPAAFPEPDGGDPDARRALERARDAWAAGRASSLSALLDAAGLAEAPEPPWAAGVLFQIAAGSARAIEDGDFRLVLNGLFQGAGLSLSRFAHLLGADAVTRELRRAWSVVERPGAIVAELTYNHLGRTANAGLRPSIFDHEIELPGDTVSARATRLALHDLTVRFCSGTERFVLRVAGGGAEVVPVINSGVNPVGFISFLVAIGEQPFQPIGYLPGFDRDDVDHWPRVTSERVVVFRERWVFRRPFWPEASARALARWRDAHALPRHVFVHTTREPKPRYVDLESPAFLDLLRRDLVPVAGDDAARLEVTEMLPGPGELWLAGHASEFLVQMASSLG